MKELNGLDSSKKIKIIGYEGVVLVADVFGNPQDPPVIFLHGGGQTRSSWGAAAQSIARNGWHTIALDLRGHGESGWTQGKSYQFKDFIDDLNILISGLEQPPVLVGASLGGIVSLLKCAEDGAEIAGLILVDIAPTIEPKGQQRVESFMMAKAFSGFSSLEEAAEYISNYIPHRKRPVNHNGLEKNLRLKEDGRWYWHWDPEMMGSLSKNRPDREMLVSAAQSLKIPTLLVRGALSDVLSEEGVRDFCSIVQHAEFVEVKNAAHMVAGDNNNIFASAVSDFLSRVRTI